MELSCLIIRSQVQGTVGSKYPTVICTEAGKPFPNSQHAVIYPHFGHARFKRLSRMPDGRHVAQLKGASRKILNPGSVLIASGQGIYCSRIGYGIARRPIPTGSYGLTGGLFREHTLPGTVEITSVSSGYCMRASVDLPLVVGGRYRLRPVDQPADRGREMPYEFVLCVPLELERQAKKSLGESLGDLVREVSQARMHAVALRLLGWVSVPTRVTSKAILEAADALKLEHAAYDSRGVVEMTGPALTRFLIVPELLAKIRTGIGRTVKQGAGETGAQIAAKLDLSADLVEAVIGGMEAEGEVAREEGIVLPAGSKAGLSPMEHGIVDQLNRDAAEGNLGRGGKAADREILRKLVRLRVLVELGDRYCTVESYTAFTRNLLNGKNPGGIVTIAEAKAALGLPREQTIQFLESLNDRGVLRRDGDIHRVVRGLGVR